MSLWGSSAADAAASITFDNLGEAAQLELGMWPEDVPLGKHFTVLEVLPRLLELLAAHSLKASFFVEGLNAEMYPDALQSIAEAGHEVAVHAWRHEQWAALDGEAERALLGRATDAMRAIGLEPQGFRPPGGLLTEQTLALLVDLGYSHVSPSGARAGVLDGLAVLPFRWPLVDAYAFLPNFAGLRERFGSGPEPLEPERMGEQMIEAVRTHAEGEGHLALIFHPFSTAFTADAGWTALEAVMTELAQLRASGALATMRMDEAARCLLAQPPQLSHPPQLESSSWIARPA